MFRDDHLAGSWSALMYRLDAADTVRRWAQAETALAGLCDLSELDEVTSQRGDPDRADEVLGALVRLAAADGGDDQDAVLVVLHLLADGANALAARMRDLTGDVLALVVGELALQIRVFPWRRRNRAYAANLLLDTRAALWRELRSTRGTRARELPLDLRDPRYAVLVDHAVTGPGQDGQDSQSCQDLADLLAWAVRRHVVAEADLRLLVELERSRGYRNHARDQVAAAFGINERTVRRRRDRALAALRAATGEYLRAVA